MAKAASSVGINEGTQVQLSAFELASSRIRQTAVISDTDDENLAAELPAHNSADRGSPLKIGGKAQNNPDTVAISDRTNAWFTTTGALAVVNTIEPRTVYDGGRQATVSQFSNVVGLTTTPVQIVTSGVGTKVKVLGVHIICNAFGTAGLFALHDGTANILGVEFFTAVGGGRTIGFGGPALCETPASAPLNVVYGGTASTFQVLVLYYRAA